MNNQALSKDTFSSRNSSNLDSIFLVYNLLYDKYFDKNTVCFWFFFNIVFHQQSNYVSNLTVYHFTAKRHL